MFSDTRSTLSTFADIFRINVLSYCLGVLCMSSVAATDCNTISEISSDECKSLLELYHSTSGVNWINNDGWNVTNTPCSWYGITCENNSVIEISLGKFFLIPGGFNFMFGSRGNNLKGTIPDFRALLNLRTLALNGNQLTGRIPDFSALPKLQKLILIGNQLTGTIPDFTALPELQELIISDNNLTGMIPNFQTLPKLQMLILTANQLTGTVPNFSALPELKGLALGSNQLTGAIPEFSAVPKLRVLALSSLFDLQSLALDSNQLTGAIPNFSNLPNLQMLILNGNQLTGAIPNFRALLKLEYLILGANQLTGAIPNFSNLPNLRGLILNGNQLTGTIPNFSGLPNLQELYLSKNRLCKAPYLNYYHLQKKVASFPDCPDLGSSQTNIVTNDCNAAIEFCSEPSSNRGNVATDCDAVTEISKLECKSLLELYHSTDGANWTNNDGWNVTNTPCSWYGIKCENNGVTEILLGAFFRKNSSFGNNLKGTIPDFMGLPNLQVLIFVANPQLTGTIPNFNALPNLEELALVGNQLSGTIPNFRALPKLRILALAGNQLTGVIPDFRTLPKLEMLFLHNNQLNTIPEISVLAKLRDNNQLCKVPSTNYSKWQPEVAPFPFCPESTPNRDNITSVCNTVTEISIAECESLLELYYSTAGANWKVNDGWNVTNTPCSWYGITCKYNGGIIGIELWSNNLKGTIVDFSALPNLRKLILFNNQLTGTIPNFSGLPKLQELVLFSNQLTGAIPNFNGLPKLEKLFLQYNELTGTIPDFRASPNLQELILIDNQLMGAIPDFKALPKLDMLGLNGNRLCKRPYNNYSKWQNEVEPFPVCPHIVIHKSK